MSEIFDSQDLQKAREAWQKFLDVSDDKELERHEIECLEYIVSIIKNIPSTLSHIEKLKLQSEILIRYPPFEPCLHLGIARTDTISLVDKIVSTISKPADTTTDSAEMKRQIKNITDPLLTYFRNVKAKILQIENQPQEQAKYSLILHGEKRDDLSLKRAALYIISYVLCLIKKIVITQTVSDRMFNSLPRKLELQRDQPIIEPEPCKATENFIQDQLQKHTLASPIEKNKAKNFILSAVNSEHLMLISKIKADPGYLYNSADDFNCEDLGKFKYSVIDPLCILVERLFNGSLQRNDDTVAIFITRKILEFLKKLAEDVNKNVFGQKQNQIIPNITLIRKYIQDISKSIPEKTIYDLSKDQAEIDSSGRIFDFSRNPLPPIIRENGKVMKVVAKQWDRKSLDLLTFIFEIHECEMRSQKICSLTNIFLTIFWIFKSTEDRIQFKSNFGDIDENSRISESQYHFLIKKLVQIFDRNNIQTETDFKDLFNSSEMNRKDNESIRNFALRLKYYHKNSCRESHECPSEQKYLCIKFFQHLKSKTLQKFISDFCWDVLHTKPDFDKLTKKVEERYNQIIQTNRLLGSKKSDFQEQIAVDNTSKSTSKSKSEEFVPSENIMKQLSGIVKQIDSMKINQVSSSRYNNQSPNRDQKYDRDGDRDRYRDRDHSYNRHYDYDRHYSRDDRHSGYPKSEDSKKHFYSVVNKMKRNLNIDIDGKYIIAKRDIPKSYSGDPRDYIPTEQYAKLKKRAKSLISSEKNYEQKRSYSSDHHRERSRDRHYSRDRYYYSPDRHHSRDRYRRTKDREHSRDRYYDYRRDDDRRPKSRSKSSDSERRHSHDHHHSNTDRHRTRDRHYDYNRDDRPRSRSKSSDSDRRHSRDYYHSNRDQDRPRDDYNRDDRSRSKSKSSDSHSKEQIPEGDNFHADFTNYSFGTVLHSDVFSQRNPEFPDSSSESWNRKFAFNYQTYLQFSNHLNLRFL